jgi:hypothetical protein
MSAAAVSGSTTARGQMFFGIVVSSEGEVQRRR